MDKAKVTNLLENNGANADGGAIECPPWRESGRGMVVATITGTDAVASTVTVSGSHDGATFVTIGAAIVPTTAGAGSDAKALAIDYPWPFLKAVSSGGSGTRTKLRVTLAQ